jgi:hypothetical protein
MLNRLVEALQHRIVCEFGLQTFEWLTAYSRTNQAHMVQHLHHHYVVLAIHSIRTRLRLWMPLSNPTH